jgi:hypothetical protein
MGVCSVGKVAVKPGRKRLERDRDIENDEQVL